MISFKVFKSDNLSPIYVQIIDYIKRGIVAGTIVHGDELPSRRALSALIGINPNTIQKAYKILEDESIIISRTGAKSYIDIDATKIQAIERQLIEAYVKSSTDAMKHMGFTLEDAKALIEKLWRE